MQAGLFARDDRRDALMFTIGLAHSITHVSVLPFISLPLFHEGACGLVIHGQPTMHQRTWYASPWRPTSPPYPGAPSDAQSSPELTACKSMKCGVCRTRGRMPGCHSGVST